MVFEKYGTLGLNCITKHTLANLILRSLKRCPCVEVPDEADDVLDIVVRPRLEDGKTTDRSYCMKLVLEDVRAVKDGVIYDIVSYRVFDYPTNSELRDNVDWLNFVKYQELHNSVLLISCGNAQLFTDNYSAEKSFSNIVCATEYGHEVRGMYGDAALRCAENYSAAVSRMLKDDSNLRGLYDSAGRRDSDAISDRMIKRPDKVPPLSKVLGDDFRYMVGLHHFWNLYTKSVDSDMKFIKRFAWTGETLAWLSLFDYEKDFAEW